MILISSIQSLSHSTVSSHNQWGIRM
uniref:Uncharacterized protein n=1 Tax=Arundo donax TaxID=35708 RepID=A0A0A9B3F8_ARUDO